MSSGRDYMMEQWSNQVELTEKHIRDSQEYQIKKKMLTRMIEYRQTVITEKERLDDAILKLEFELAQLETK